MGTRVNEDLDDAISLYTSVDTGCSVVNCLSKYNGPGGKKTKNGTCLSEMENGIYSCCLLNQTVCQNEDCKYINVSTEYHTYTNTVGKTESTSPSITMNGEVDNHNTEVTIVIIVLVVVILVVFVLGAIILNRKKICKNSKRGAEKPTEENGHMLSEGTV
ncbi:hypothetical protein KUTeg_009234 [Tegillarca granosa]|uniref:Uncharacterized protein n=1 Tax=Tegillarca granosa TaxID=220873 RepID=A0ABQ9FC53_TEGGR|nr:hypothetical protein KUTeg_009234 [Tegillarca granosa]